LENKIFIGQFIFNFTTKTMEAFRKVALLQEKMKVEQEKSTEENLDREFKKHMTTYFIHKKKNQKIKPKKEKHVEVIER
jgi:hypothetical protein